MAARVLVTRPEPGATRTAARLAERGFVPVRLPLTETVALPVELQSPPGDIDAVAVTSANALRHAPAGLIEALKAKKCFAVGERTAKQARALGFAAVETGDGDADALAGLVMRRVRHGARLVYLCGRVRMSGFEARLAEAGIAVYPLETYDTRTIGYERDQLATAVGAEPIDAVLLYSAKAAGRFLELSWPPEAVRMLAAAEFLCLSQRVAERLADVFGARIRIAAEPSEAALLRLLGPPAV
jgi:uroporphyrinogen-III synthase